MAPKRNLQQSLDATDAKRIGKKAVIEDSAEKRKEEDLASSQIAADQKDVPESSSKKDSTSESETEDDEEALDVWEREAKKLYVHKDDGKDDGKWRPWSARESMIIFVGAYHAKAAIEEQSIEKQVVEEQVTEEKETAQTEQVDAKETDDADDDPEAPVAPDVPTATEVQPASADAQVTAADFSPVPPQTNN